MLLYLTFSFFLILVRTFEVVSENWAKTATMLNQVPFSRFCSELSIDFGFTFSIVVVCDLQFCLERFDLFFQLSKLRFELLTGLYCIDFFVKICTRSPQVFEAIIELFIFLKKALIFRFLLRNLNHSINRKNKQLSYPLDCVHEI